MGAPVPVLAGERTASALPRDLSASVRESASRGSGGRRPRLPSRGPRAGRREKVRGMREASRHGADLAYSASVAGALAATGVHLEGTQTIGDSTATPRRRPALDREGPSTVLLALRLPGVVALVYSSLTSGHVQVGANHQVPGGTWSHSTCCFQSWAVSPSPPRSAWVFTLLLPPAFCFLPSAFRFTSHVPPPGISSERAK